MKLQNLLTTKKWTSLVDVLGGIREESFVGASLYRVDDSIYLFLSKFKLENSKEESVGPFVSGILFAPDDGAAKRVSMSMIEEDLGRHLLPPALLYLRASEFRYSDILSNLKGTHPKVCQESASYRIATDGQFIHRKIETESYTYYFRSMLDDPNEPPYAILKKL